MSNSNNNSSKRALLIGINKYPKLAPRYQLSGCVNDVKLMANTLTNNFGFPKENVKLLRDEEATREGILKAMDELVDCTGENDVVVVHYSGHGSQRTDLEGDEPDKKDETIVPSDSGRQPNPNRDISDDEIYLWLLRLTKNTDYVTLIFDCCHSGTITRDSFGAKERRVEPDLRTAEEMGLKPVELGHAGSASRDLGPSGWLPLSKRYVLIAGCHDSESSFEYTVHQNGSSEDYGALTYFLNQELVKATPGTTYRSVFERASAQVAAYEARQHPQMEGARDRELFGIHDINPLRFVTVKSRQMAQITLAAGAAHGLTVNSRWAVYPQTINQATEETHKQGVAEITDVMAVTSIAKILEESQTDPIAADSKALEETHFHGNMQMVVDIQAPTGYEIAVQDLNGLIQKSSLLLRAEKQEEADVRVYVIPPRMEVGEGDPVPQLGSLSEAIWAVVRGGRLIMPPHPLSETNSVYLLRDNLEKLARYRYAMAIRNPNDDNPLKGKIDFRLLRMASDGSWMNAEPENESGMILYSEGDRIAFKIINNYSSSVYVSILDFGLKGAIDLLHPIQGASEELVSKMSIEVGTRVGDELTLCIPEGFAEADDPEDKAPIGGIETYKLLVTTHEADFHLLTQDNYRSIGDRTIRGADMPLFQLLDMALTGYGTRQTIRNRLNPNEEWITLERSFFLKAKSL